MQRKNTSNFSFLRNNNHYYLLINYLLLSLYFLLFSQISIINTQSTKPFYSSISTSGFPSLSSSSLLSSPKIIEVDYYLSFDTFFIKMDLGSQEKYFQIDLHSKFNYISKNQKFVLSESVQKDIGRDFNIKGQTVLIWQYYDKLAYKGIKFPDFYFYFYEDYLEKADTLSLSYQVEKEEQSLTSGLKKLSLIDEEIFGFSKVNEADNSGTLFLGGIPEEYFRLYDYKKCQILNNTQSKAQPSWGCSISYAAIGNTYYDSKGEFGYFQTSRRFIFAPKKFILLLNNLVLNKFFSEGLCFKMNNEEYLFCKEEAVKNFPNITLNFGEMEIVLTSKELFEEYGSVYLFMIYEKYNYETLWMLGYRFFKKHPIFFDKENDEVIIFYNEGRRLNLTNEIKRKCMIGVILLSAFALCVLLLTQTYDPILLKETDE